MDRDCSSWRLDFSSLWRQLPARKSREKLETLHLLPTATDQTRACLQCLWNRSLFPTLHEDNGFDLFRVRLNSTAVVVATLAYHQLQVRLLPPSSLLRWQTAAQHKCVTDISFSSGGVTHPVILIGWEFRLVFISASLKSVLYWGLGELLERAAVDSLWLQVIKWAHKDCFFMTKIQDKSFGECHIWSGS